MPDSMETVARCAPSAEAAEHITRVAARVAYFDGACGMLTMPRCDCDNDRVPGAAWPMASDGDDAYPYVERCDDCKRFPDDLTAAEAVAQAIGGEVEWADVHDRAGKAQPYVRDTAQEQGR